LQRAASALSPACIGLLSCLHFSTQQPASEKPKAKHVRSFAFLLILCELALALPPDRKENANCSTKSPPDLHIQNKEQDFFRLTPFSCGR